MKLGPNRLRYVGYSGDGVDSFHCMRCRSRIGICAKDPVYCPFCGTRWETGHVNGPEPRRRAWMRVLYERECADEIIVWRIEWRMHWSRGNPPGAWYLLTACPHERLDLVRYVRRLREESGPDADGYGEEYRLALRREHRGSPIEAGTTIYVVPSPPFSTREAA